MTKESSSTRRAFLRGSAIMAAPIAVATIPAVALADDRSIPRAERLRNEAAIRELHQAWLRRVNAGERDALLDSTVRRIIADHAGAPERIDIAADDRSACGYFDYAIEFETPLVEDCTLAQMAHAQGHGTLQRTERRLMTVNYTKSEGSWNIAKIALARA